MVSRVPPSSRTDSAPRAACPDHAAELGQEGPAPGHCTRSVGVPVVHRGEELEHGVVTLPALHRQRPLTHLWEQGAGIEQLGDVVGEAQALEGGVGEHARPDVECSLAPGGHVAAQLAEGEIRAQPRQLGAASYRPGGHGGACRQTVEGGADQGVAGIGSFGHARQHQSGRGLRRQILGGVHGQVGPAVEDGALHLLHERALPPELGHRDVAGEGVAGRLPMTGSQCGAPGKRPGRSAAPQAPGTAPAATPGSLAAARRVVAPRRSGSPLRQRSNSVRSASTRRSPRGVPAASFTATVG